jgi:hypothetical protein
MEISGIAPAVHDTGRVKVMSRAMRHKAGASSRPYGVTPQKTVNLHSGTTAYFTVDLV